MPLYLYFVACLGGDETSILSPTAPLHDRVAPWRAGACHLVTSDSHLLIPSPSYSISTVMALFLKGLLLAAALAAGSAQQTNSTSYNGFIKASGLHFVDAKCQEFIPLGFNT